MFKVSEQYINCRCGLHLKEYQKNDPNSGKLGIINSKGKFTSCHKHEHISRETYNEVIPQIISEFVNAGFVNTNAHFEKSLDSMEEYKHLTQMNVHPNEITAQKTSKSNKLIRKYMPHIYEVEDHRGNSMITRWTEANLVKAFKSLDKPNATVNSNLSEIKRAIKFNPITIYSPIMSKSIIRELDCKTVFDPCIGWGGRMLGTTCLGKDYHYTGCEPFTKTYDGLIKIRDDLGIQQQVELYNKPVEQIIETIQDKTFDMCLTSPPYYNLEVYSHEDTQSIHSFNTYDSWITGFIKPIIDYVCSHVTKYSCWSVKNIKSDGQYTLLDDVIQLHKEHGWILETQYSIKKNTQKSKSTDGDVTYVFVKK
tara:strand:- start:4054 stop:5151 length:1098 start_codon:yes stop_codon:yes gene_type:complete